MKNNLKAYVGFIYLFFLATLLFSWESYNANQFILMISFIFVTALFNLEAIIDVQSKITTTIIYPFVIPTFVFLEPFYGMIFVFITTAINYRRSIWYKQLYNATTNGIMMFIVSYIFHMAYPVIVNSYIFSANFFIIVFFLTLLYALSLYVFVIIVVKLEMGKLGKNVIISMINSLRTSAITIFIGLINVIIFYYTNIFGVAIFSFLVYFIKPALQYRQIFDNELSTFTDFILHIIKQMDPITHDHSERVKFWIELFAIKLNLSMSEKRQLSQAASWHDIGKIEVPLDIITKPGRLTEAEYDLIKEHPEKGYQLVEDMEFFREFLPVIRYHHERYDGKGYPSGLSGDSIPYHARIMAITDSFDAMISDRPYHKAMSLEDAVQELQRCSGTQFDPKLVKVFIEAIKEKYGENYQFYNDKDLLNVT